MFEFRNSDSFKIEIAEHQKGMLSSPEKIMKAGASNPFED
jgi:hypothetical protein